jgi:hypothetical protein
VSTAPSTPPPSDPASNGHQRGRIQAVAATRPAGGWVGLRLDDGSERRLSVPEGADELLRPGLEVILYHGAGGGLAGWYVPDQGIGFDLRS